MDLRERVDELLALGHRGRQMPGHASGMRRRQVRKQHVIRAGGGIRGGIKAAGQGKLGCVLAHQLVERDFLVAHERLEGIPNRR